MKHLTKIFTFLVLMISYSVFACDCDSQGNFLEVAPKSDFVALVKVTKYLSFREIYDEKTPMSMEVEIIDVYKGKETRKTVIVWGDYGHLCRPYLSIFKEGQYYVIAFQRGSDGSIGYVHKNEKKTDYAISICGDYWLKVDIQKQTANGFITKNQNQIKLKDLKNKF